MRLVSCCLQKMLPSSLGREDVAVPDFIKADGAVTVMRHAVFRVNVAHIRQSRLDFGLDFLVKVLTKR